MDRLADARAGAAAADIADGATDVFIGRQRFCGQQRGRRHDHAGLAVAAADTPRRQVLTGNEIDLAIGLFLKCQEGLSARPC